MIKKLVRFPDELVELITASQDRLAGETFTSAVRRLILAGLATEKAKEKK
jgi:hypothetical protein